MVLDKKQLVLRLELPTSDINALIVTPLVARQKAIGEDSIDLRLGTDFFITRSDRLASNIPGLSPAAAYQRSIHVPLGRYLVLPGHHTTLASTLEFIKLPPNLCAMVMTKSSWARTFITIETAPWVHPNYRGCLTLEIANVSETPIILYSGLTVAQIVFLELTGEDKPEALSGKYVGPTKPEPPVFGKTDKVLETELGLPMSECHYPPDGCG